MKNALGILMIALVGSLHAEPLAFEETSKEIHASADDKMVTADFKFTNKSKREVKIAKYDGGCSCMSVKIGEGKMSYAPGESGVVRADFDLGNFSGSTTKEVALWVEGDLPASPSSRLSVKVNIPVLISIEPKTVKWTVGGKNDPQKMTIRMNHDKPVKIVKLTASPEATFNHELKTLEEGKSYELTISPKAIDTPGMAIFRIETDLENARHKIQNAFGVVTKANSGQP